MRTLEPPLAKALDALGIEKLNDVQMLAEDKGIFTSQDNYVLMSQSRTGKTFTGIMFVANQMFREISQAKAKGDTGQDVVSIFLAPFHASLRETAATIARYLGWFLRPLILFRGREVSDIILRITKGMSPNIIIATPDAFLEFLRFPATKEWLFSRRVVATVMDDVHSILHDPIRGLRLFEVAQILHHEFKNENRLLILSGEFRNPERLEAYLDATLIRDEADYDSPSINLVNYENTDEKEKKLTSLLETLADEGNKTLVYMRSIDTIGSYLDKKGLDLATSVSYDLDPLIKERLGRVAKIVSEGGYPSPNLLKHSLGIYHGMMTESERWFVEWAFRRGYLRFLLGTEALGYGITAPVSHVVMESPGMDEIFRQSMMARAVRLRKGRIRPGKCTVFAKTIKDVNLLKEVYDFPSMPLRFIDDGNLSSLLLGLIGQGIMKSERDRKKVSETLNLFFKKGSTSKVLKQMRKFTPPLIDVDDDSNYVLTPLGRAAYNSSISFPVATRILEGLQLLQASKSPIKLVDLLILANHASLARSRKKKGQPELSGSTQDIYLKEYDSAIASSIIDTTLESVWREAIEFSLLILDGRNREGLDLITKKSRRRIQTELRLFLPHLTTFLASLKETPSLTGIISSKLLKKMLDLLKDDKLSTLISDESAKIESGLRFKDLSFVDFGKIEQSIDLALESSLSPLQKARLIDLLETVQHTTMAFVELLEKKKDDPTSKEVLDVICGFSEEGLVGRNLIKALEEEGVVERGTIEGLWHRFSSEVESIQKRTDAPAKAASVLFSLFTGDIVGLATNSIDAIKVAFGRTRKVDVSKLS